MLEYTQAAAVVLVLDLHSFEQIKQNNLVIFGCFWAEVVVLDLVYYSSERIIRGFLVCFGYF
ncbi:hypothetical protein AVI53_02525 [Piscirickettsia salmonis]|nr:hypothetical protein PSLF89_05985 [Piscirickettsia salmonis LF-89 = ATCC VR-1361]ALY02844.1 hypothetical protein AWE47_08255 [Piscirickettsia salmonis]AMA42399.1 hypothetical protein AWJ11_08470 [Piscirickettsia salmonis]AOS34869.1 hypothetical protein AVM72_05610 [Piscirickettsia salmonis]APS59578.1 hypothetical protein AVI53_02525 [Piscirickettsia salmonis]